MSEKEISEKTKEWFKAAEEDLDAAKILLLSNHYRHAVYLIHQSVEKFLKSFLVRHNKPVPKTLDLLYILDLCKEIEPEFQKLEFIKKLSLYHFARYPPMFVFEKEDVKKGGRNC